MKLYLLLLFNLYNIYIYIYKMKEEDLLVKVNFYTKYEIIKEQEFPIDTSFEKIIEYFNNNVTKEKLNDFDNYQLNLKSVYKMNDTIIKNEDTIKSLMQSTDITELSEAILWIEVEEAEKQSNYISSNLDEDISMIYKPKSNPFSIFSFNIKLGIVILEPYSEEIINTYELNKFNNSSAYCNSPFDLFLSGGNSDNNISNNFWIIDSKKSITKKEMPSPKENHSMLYLKEKYILITGGNDLKTFFYDINKNSFITCADLNHKCLKPALFRYNNYIYCLSDLNEEKQSFERLYIEGDLSLCKWENIYPTFANASDSVFSVKNFGVSSEVYNGVIILGGGNINKHNTYVYDVENNILALSDGKNENVFLEEKTFYKYEREKDYFVNFSGDFEKKQEIVFVNQKNKSVILVDVDSIDGKINKDKINENNEKIKNEENQKKIGNVSLRIIYKKKENEKLKYEIFGEKITPIFDDIIDEIDLNDLNVNKINDDQKKDIEEKEEKEKKEDNKEEFNSNDNNIIKSRTEKVITLNEMISNDDENKLNISNKFAVKNNVDNNKNKEEDTKHKITNKVNKAIKGIKHIFKHKKKEGEEDEKEKKEESENEGGESKISKTKKYLGKLKDKFIKRRDSSVDHNNNMKKKKEEEKKDKKKERHNSITMKGYNPEE